MCWSYDGQHADNLWIISPSSLFYFKDFASMFVFQIVFGPYAGSSARFCILRLFSCISLIITANDSHYHCKRTVTVDITVYMYVVSTYLALTRFKPKFKNLNLPCMKLYLQSGGNNSEGIYIAWHWSMIQMHGTFQIGYCSDKYDKFWVHNCSHMFRSEGLYYYIP